MKKITALVLAAILALACFSFAAAEELPEGYPAIIEGLDFGGQTVYIYDWWSKDDENHSTREAEPDEDTQKLYDYRDWLEKTYNVKIVNCAWDKGGWQESPQELANMVNDGKADQLCLIIIDPNFTGGPLANGLTEPWTIDLTGPQWLTSVSDLMTKDGKVYGVLAADQEPREVIFFNKKVLEDAGIKYEEIYDLAKNGEWTWAKFQEYMEKVQQDKDNDGINDIWALTGNGDRLLRGCVFGNGGSFFDMDENGKLVITADDEKTLKGITQRQEWDRFMPQKADFAPDGEWNWFEGFWKQGTTAFFVGQNYEGQNPDSLMRSCDFEWGYVPFPKGPDADDYLYAAVDNVCVIPAKCYDAETVLKLEQIYALYTYPTPGVDPATSWIGDKYTFMDDDAVDFTFATLRDPKHAVGNKTYLLGDENTVLGSTLYWNLGSGTAAEIVEAAKPIWQFRCDVFNGDKTAEELNNYIEEQQKLAEEAAAAAAEEAAEEAPAEEAPAEEAPAEETKAD